MSLFAHICHLSFEENRRYFEENIYFYTNIHYNIYTSSLYIFFLCQCLSANLLTHTVQRCHGNIPAKGDEDAFQTTS